MNAISNDVIVPGQPGNGTARSRTRDLSITSPTPYNHYITDPPEAYLVVGVLSPAASLCR